VARIEAEVFSEPSAEFVCSRDIDNPSEPLVAIEACRSIHRAAARYAATAPAALPDALTAAINPINPSWLDQSIVLSRGRG
jgi:hypothetical protein